MQYYKLSNGYTLLELLVVMLIFSLLAGVTIPRLTTMYDSVQTAFERDEVFARLGELGYLSFRQSRDFTLTDYPPIYENDPYTLEEIKPVPKLPTNWKLPKDWQIRVDAPILFRANGACNGGILQLQYQQQKIKIQLKPPFCQPEIITGI